MPNSTQPRIRNGVFLTTAPMDESLSARLLQIGQNASTPIVHLTENEDFLEEDKLIQKNVVIPIAKAYTEHISGPIINKDGGFDLIPCQPHPTETDCFSWFSSRVEASTTKLACVLILNTLLGNFELSNLNLRIPLTKNYAILFPANWWYKPALKISSGVPDSERLFIVTTFLN